MKAFVTGATGFIGKRLVQKLIDRGYQVNALVRSQSSADEISNLGANPIWGDITNVESMREGMQDCQVVFHLAAWYKLGVPDQRKAEQINVEGTRNVLSLAHSLGIPRIVYTSTVAVFGDTHGFMADEKYVGLGDTFLTEYDRTKWLAHYRVALPLIDQGAPIIIVMPGAVYGPDDPSLVGDMMRYFYKGLFPVLPGPELTLTYAHVDDIAEGHILAAEKGKIGESYLLTGPALSNGEAVKLWAQVSGKKAPYLNIPARFVKLLAPLADLLNTLFSLPILSRDSVVILDATYIASSDKARQELGWQPRSLEEGFRQTFEHIAQTTRRINLLPETPKQRRTLAGFALGAAIGLLLVWLLARRRR